MSGARYFAATGSASREEVTKAAKPTYIILLLAVSWGWFANPHALPKSEEYPE